MCKFWSCLIKKDKTVLSEIGIDNHHELVEIFKLDDNTSHQDELTFARVEIVPPNNDPFEPIENWNFQVDERIRPIWFSPAHEKACWNQLREVLKQVLITEDTDELRNRKGIFIKHCTVGELIDTTVQRMYGSSVVQRMYGSSVVQRMYGSSVVQHMYGSSVVQHMSGSSVVQHMSGSSVVQRMYGSSVVQRMSDSSVVQRMYGSSVVQRMSDSSVVQRMYGSSVVQHMSGSSVVTHKYSAGKNPWMTNNAIVIERSDKLNIIHVDTVAGAE